jgi:hypothetical protein
MSESLEGHGPLTIVSLFIEPPMERPGSHVSLLCEGGNLYSILSHFPIVTCDRCAHSDQGSPVDGGSAGDRNQGLIPG